MDLETLKFLLSMPFGVLLAYIVMKWKRQDDQTYQKNLEITTDRAIRVVEANTNVLRALQSAVEAVASVKRIEEDVREIKEEMRDAKR